MDVRVHDEILWRACELANKRGGLLADPRTYFPLLARGSWILDYRQSTIVLDVIEKAGPNPNVRSLLCELWHADREALLTRMKESWKADSAVLAGARALLVKDTHLDDFGSYGQADHFDVLSDTDADAAKEEAAFLADTEHGRSARIGTQFGFHIPSRLQNALLTMGGAPASWDFMGVSQFGQALHMVADFWAHTNYVELLLWSLAWKGHLSAPLIDAFNSTPDLPPGSAVHCRCPLPGLGEVEALTRRNTMFCYRETPEQTPLVSTVFVTKDTIYSLLDRYAQHLLLFDGELGSLSPAAHAQKLNEKLDLAMGLFCYSQTPVIGAVMDCYLNAKSMLHSAGVAVKKKLCELVRWLVERDVGGLSKSDKERILTTADVVSGINPAEASKWARAGEFKYILHVIERQLAQELDYGDTPIAKRTFRMPHHTLLRKDANKSELSGEPEAAQILRYNLACMLATEATAQLIAWRFSSEQPALPAARKILDRMTCHPKNQLSRLDAKELSSLTTLVNQDAAWPWSKRVGTLACWQEK